MDSFRLLAYTNIIMKVYSVSLCCSCFCMLCSGQRRLGSTVINLGPAIAAFAEYAYTLSFYHPKYTFYVMLYSH